VRLSMRNDALLHTCTMCKPGACSVCSSWCRRLGQLLCVGFWSRSLVLALTKRPMSKCNIQSTIMHNGSHQRSSSSCLNSPVVHVIDPATTVCAVIQGIAHSVNDKPRLVDLQQKQ